MKLPLVLAAVSLALASRAARAEEPAAPAAPAAGVQPEVRYPPSSVRIKLIVGGLAVSGVAYAAALLSRGLLSPTFSDSDPKEVKKEKEKAKAELDGLTIPIAGPWMALGRISCATSTSGSQDSKCGVGAYVRGALYALNGIGQLAGLGLVGEAIFMKTEAKPAPKNSLALGLPGGVTLHPLPMITARFTGLGCVGTF